MSPGTHIGLNGKTTDPVDPLGECVERCRTGAGCVGVAMWARVRRNGAQTECWPKGEPLAPYETQDVLFHDLRCGKGYLKYIKILPLQ